MPITDDPNDPRLKRSSLDEKGQHEVYLVLSEEERAKGFVRPYRDSYVHMGIRPKYPTRPLWDEEKSGEEFGYVAYEEYPESEAPKVGRYWTLAELNSGCGTVTKMGRALSETYARDPKFYGATYCCGCQKHLRVEEFVWDADGQVVGS